MTAKQSTTPRKAAKGRTKAVTNGHQPAASAEPNGAVPYEPPTTIRPPEEFVPPAIKEHPIYGTKKIFTYRPRDGSDPIEFPHINAVTVTPKFFWKIYAMNEMFQSFEWMNQAEVPRPIQERVMDLPDDEKAAFFRGWFQAIAQPQGVAPPGES